MINFKLSEFDCSHTGKNEMDALFLANIDELRTRCGFPFTITSAYRDVTHPVEAKKSKGGTHTQGIAADIRVANGNQKHIIVKEAMAMGFTGIGIANTFIHVDTRKSVPVIWTY